MNGQSAKTVLLVLLLVVTVVVVWRQFGGGEDGGAGRRARAEAGATELPTVDPVQLGLLDIPVPGYDPKGRNLFVFTTPPPDPEEVRAREEAERRRREEEEKRRLAEEERRRRLAEQARKAREEQDQQQAKIDKAEAAKPKPPEITLSYVGYVGPMDGRVAVLLDPEGEIVVGKEGEVVREHFRILRIGYTYLEMGYVAFDGSQPLPLGDGAQGGRGRS
jgi:hypothetical protein